MQLPFGGVAESGYGRFTGEEGLRGLSNSKSVCMDRLGWLGVRNAIPPPVRYPVKDLERAGRFLAGVVELAYGLTGRRKMGGLASILNNS